MNGSWILGLTKLVVGPLILVGSFIIIVFTLISVDFKEFFIGLAAILLTLGGGYSMIKNGLAELRSKKCNKILLMLEILYDFYLVIIFIVGALSNKQSLVEYLFFTLIVFLFSTFSIRNILILRQFNKFIEEN